jgi:hypothetical protein
MLKHRRGPDQRAYEGGAMAETEVIHSCSFNQAANRSFGPFNLKPSDRFEHSPPNR